MKNLFVSLLPSSETGSVIITKPEKIVVRHEPLDGVSHNVNINRVSLDPKSI